MKITQLQSKEQIFINKIGSLGVTINHGSSGANFQDATLDLIEGGVKVTVRKPGTKDKYFAIIPWGTVKAATGSETGELVEESIKPAR